ncbi:M56 family metallopeptidase [Flavitalea flava]
MHLFTQSPLLKALGWSLLNSLWQMAGLWFLYGLLSLVFSKATANARHGLALLLLGMGTFLSGYTFISAYFFPEKSGTFFLGLASEASQWQNIQQFLRDGLPYLSSLYLLVLTVLFIRFFRNYIQSSRLHGVSVSKAPPELRVFIERTSLALGIGKNVKIWLSSLVTSPVTHGFLKPVILLPLAMAGNLNLQQTEAILLHELAHIKRHDYLLNVWLGFVELFFFFNPFSLLLIRNIKREREHCCDDLVLQFNYDPHAYATALLSLAKNDKERQPQLALAASGNNDRLLLKRVKRILKQKETPSYYFGANRVISGILVLASAFFYLSGSSDPVPVSGPFSTPSVSSLPSDRSVQFVPSIPSVPGSIVSQSKEEDLLSPFLIYRLSGSGEVKIQSAIVLRQNTLLRENRKERKPAIIDSDKDVAKERTPSEWSDQIPAVEEIVGEESESDQGTGTFASAIQPDEREFTLRSVGDVAASSPSNIYVTEAPEAPENRQPFVPATNFTFRFNQDTIQPDGRQLVYLQKSAAREVGLAIKNMQLTIQRQLKIIQALPSQQSLPYSTEKASGISLQKAKEQVRIQIRILEEQLKLQQEFLLKQQELERKLEKTGKRLTIVVI